MFSNARTGEKASSLPVMVNTETPESAKARLMAAGWEFPNNAEYDESAKAWVIGAGKKSTSPEDEDGENGVN